MSSAIEPLAGPATRVNKRNSRPAIAPGAEARRVRWRLLALSVAIAVGLLLIRERGEPQAVGTYERSLVASLAARGLTVEAASVHFLSPADGRLEVRPAYFLAARGQGAPDLYHAWVRTAPPATVLDTWLLTNVTRSPTAFEQDLVAVGDSHLAYQLGVAGRTQAVVVVANEGEGPELTEGWPLYAKGQNAVTNLQDTGRWSGFGARRYRLNPPAQYLRLEDATLPGRSRLWVHADGETLVIDPRQAEILAGADRLALQPVAKGRPGRLTWLVDTVRNLSFVGPEPIEWLEHRVFGLRDRADRAMHGVIGTDTEAEVARALGARAVTEPPGGSGPVRWQPQPPHGSPTGSPAAHGQTSAESQPEEGPDDWPPPPLRPVLAKPVRGEGRWLPVADDPFVLSNPGAPPAFAQTFIRVDPERAFTRIYITAWDPRQVQLHLAMGTREPEDASGQTGSGQVPSDPALLSRLVGGFNGGFQALHGEFGMMAEGHIYLPPKPYAATVAVFEDGSVGLGSWPAPPREGWTEESANAQVPPTMRAMRQNLTSVVEDGVYNPWKRWWWGAAPSWVTEQTYIHRTGLCLTEEGFLAFFWGESMGPEELGTAMLTARCRRGMHLDMNSKHTGLEFYRPRALADGPFEPLGRPLTEAEFEGQVGAIASHRFRARKAVRTMTPLRFPRYLEMDKRDFFYLSLRPVLPGSPLGRGPRKVAFSTAGLPTAGWPHPLARAELTTAAGARLYVLRIDPNRTQLAPPVADKLPEGAAGAPQLGTVASVQPLAYLSAGSIATRGSACMRRRLHHGTAQAVVSACDAGEGELILRAQRLSESPQARAAIGVDPSGFIVYAEGEGGADPGALRLWFAEAGVLEPLAMPEGARLLLHAGEPRVPAVYLDGAAAAPGALTSAQPLWPRGAPMAQVLHPEVEPRPYRMWGWIQGRRVRYFPAGEPRFKRPGSDAEALTEIDEKP